MCEHPTVPAPFVEEPVLSSLNGLHTLDKLTDQRAVGFSLLISLCACHTTCFPAHTHQTVKEKCHLLPSTLRLTVVPKWVKLGLLKGLWWALPTGELEAWSRAQDLKVCESISYEMQLFLEKGLIAPVRSSKGP